MKLAAFIITGVITSTISLKYFPSPYIWISFVFMAIMIYGALSSKRTSVKMICFNIGFIALILCGLESYLWISEILGNNERFEGDYVDGGYFVNPEDILGYVPIKEKAVTAKKYFKDQLLYDVTYTINTQGLRVSPPSIKNEIKECILFFGGSFTFGEGVQDNETMPYMVGIKSHEKYSIYNFAFHGYGPHQMLSSIEHALVDSTVDCQPKYAIYQALVIHVDRSAGISFWDKHGPRYVLDLKGTAQYDGHFNDDNNDLFIIKTALNQIYKSYVFKKYFNRHESVSKANIDLFVAIVNKAKLLLQKSYPGLKFHIILWDKPRKNYEVIINLLREKDIEVHPIETVLPDYPSKKSKYELLPPIDAHPNTLANTYIAEYVISQILQQ